MWIENIKAEPISLKQKKVTLDPAECEDYFISITDYQKNIDIDFKDHEILTFTYEDLAEENRKVIDALYVELNVEKFKRDSELKKQNPESLQEF